MHIWFFAGMFIADILPRPEKATTIPPNLQRILGTKDMFPIRIRIIHSSMQFGVRDGSSGQSPVAKVTSPVPIVISPVAKEQSQSTEKSSVSPVPAPIPTRTRRSKGEGKKRKRGESFMEKQQKAAEEEADNSRKNAEAAERNGAFVGLSGLSRLNLKIDGYSGLSGTSVSTMNSDSSANFAGEKFHFKVNTGNGNNKNYIPRNPHRTPTPPLLCEQTVAGKSLEKTCKDISNNDRNDKKLTKLENIGKVENPSSEKMENVEKLHSKDKTENIPLGQVMFIPITATNNTSNFMSCFPGTDFSGFNNQNTNSVDMKNTDGSSNNIRSALLTPIVNSRADASVNNAASLGNLNSVVNDSTKEQKTLRVTNDIMTTQPGDRLPNSSEPNTPVDDQSKPDVAKYVPAGFLVVPSPNSSGNSNSQGNTGLAVKALVVGPQNVVANTKLTAGINLRSLPPSFRLSPVIKNVNVPVKCSDGKTTHIKLSASGTDASEALSRPSVVNEMHTSPPAKVVKKSEELSVLNSSTITLNTLNTPTTASTRDSPKDQNLESKKDGNKCETLLRAKLNAPQLSCNSEASRMLNTFKE